VAQLQYQDPLQPADGTQFVTQLAQYADLEQQIGSHQDLDAIKQVLTTPATPDATGASSTAGTGTANPSTGQDSNSNTTATGGTGN
jgi:flagellar basal-body rod modification protein FlgD